MLMVYGFVFVWYGFEVLDVIWCYCDEYGELSENILWEIFVGRLFKVFFYNWFEVDVFFLVGDIDIIFYWELFCVCRREMCLVGLMRVWFYY